MAEIILGLLFLASLYAALLTVILRIVEGRFPKLRELAILLLAFIVAKVLTTRLSPALFDTVAVRMLFVFLVNTTLGAVVMRYALKLSWKRSLIAASVFAVIVAGVVHLIHLLLLVNSRAFSA